MKLNKKQIEARKRVCLPLDGLNTIEEIKSLVKELSPYVGLFKIGKETFTRFGPKAIKIVQESGSGIFLDLKYYDIPNTVKGASKAAADLGVYMFNVHASGGLEMMKAAKEGIKESKNKPKIIAVTILTSFDQETMNNELNIYGDINAQVLHLAKLANKAKLDGIVCSANDLEYVRDKLPKSFMYITPGIKGPNIEAGSDQKRVTTPADAIKKGSSILVVGRAITKAKDKVKAAIEVLDDIAKVL